MSTTHTSSQSTRVDWLDATKGALIILVVIGHAWRGIAGTGLIPADVFIALDARIYAFHMPGFFAIAGWFFISSLSHTNVPGYARRRLMRLFWPMVLWTYIFLGFKVLAGSMANVPIQPEDFFVSPVPGILHLWFLWALLVLSFACLYLMPFAKRGTGLGAVLALSCVAFIALRFVPMSPDVVRWIGPAVLHAPFFFLGVVLGHYAPQLQTSGWVRGLAALIFAVLIALWPQVDAAGFAPLGSFLLTLSLLVVFAGFQRAADGGVMRLLSELGKASMAIYLAHTIFSAGIREVLLVLGIEDLSVQLSLGILLGIIGPYILYRMVLGTRMARFLGF